MHSNSNTKRPSKDLQRLIVLQWNAMVKGLISLSDINEINYFSSNNGAEIVKLDAWEWKKHFKTYGCYSATGNTKLGFRLLTIAIKAILCGDFSAHSQLWNYEGTNSAELVMEDLLNSDKLEILYNVSAIPIYLHYNGSGTNPNLTFASADISDFARKGSNLRSWFWPLHDCDNFQL
ncbi:hypothetical protein TNCT_167361 [Trichonephila clavata]|uniref:Endonuclease/exonuclease/phosphatase domain-containing protein n=1 Tax=Trichonephila clavata TaxID=2740835 RepID=A0A8X6HG98_TRICU|nr:hypothetical protein TNCT_167361 [Trichonephila clavata]